MSKLVAKLMLALLMLPTAAAMYIAGVVIGFEALGWGAEDAVFLLVSAVVLGYVVMYWLWLWRGTVVWTARRRNMTIGSGFAAIVIGVFAGSVGFSTGESSFGIFLAAVVAGLAWLLLTVLVWRETNEERQTRLRAFGGGTIVCASCGYNLTGLKRTLCPECGAEPTVEELIAGQPSREDDELTAGPRSD